MVQKIKKPKNTQRVNAVLLTCGLLLFFFYVGSSVEPALAVTETKRLSRKIAELDEQNAQLARTIAALEGNISSREFLDQKGFVYQPETIYINNPALSLEAPAQPSARF